jgi:hypothetical protein
MTIREQDGFLRDCAVPRSASRAHVGGRVVPGTESSLRQAMDGLVKAIDREIDQLIATGWNPSSVSEHCAGGTPTRLHAPDLSVRRLESSRIAYARRCGRLVSGRVRLTYGEPRGAPANTMDTHGEQMF